MLITRKSQYSGKIHEKELDITPEQCERYASGELLQNAFPNLSKEDREFYKSGITNEEWLELFGIKEDSEEEDD
jgi:hypothetical protein